MNINSGDTKLVLLCPALKKCGTAKTVEQDAVILYSLAGTGRRSAIRSGKARPE